MTPQWRSMLRIAPGTPVDLVFTGANLAGGRKAQVRKLWHTGISEQQRIQTATQCITGYLATRGYLQSKVESSITSENGRKRVEFVLTAGLHYRSVETVIAGASPDRAKETHSLIRNTISANRCTRNLTAFGRLSRAFIRSVVTWRRRSGTPVRSRFRAQDRTGCNSCHRRTPVSNRRGEVFRKFRGP